MTDEVIAPPTKIFTPRIRPGVRASQDQVRTAVDDSNTTIIEWLTEGFDTADLQEAKAMLAELGA